MEHKIDPEKKFFNTKEAVQKYGNAMTKVGLWESERILLERYANQFSNIIDIGCGAGRTTFSMYDLGYHNIIGIDIADMLINIAIEYSKTHKYKIHFEKMDATNMGFESGKFDIALFSYNGLTGIPTEKRRLEVLDEIYRVLKTGGYFIFTAHDRDDDLKSRSFWIHEKERWDNGQNNPQLYEYGDVLVYQGSAQEFLHYYNKNEMISFIRKTKFQIIENVKRSELSEERKEVKEFSAETYFWILKK